MDAVRIPSLRPQAGGSLDPTKILGRDALVADMLGHLAGNVPLLVTDPRRMGKTCLLDRLAYLTEAPWTTVKIDYEGVTTSDEFLRRTIDALRAHQTFGRRAVDAVKAFVPNIELAGGPIVISAAFKARPATDLLETVLDRVDHRLEGAERLVFALDEVPLALENIVKQEGALAADALLQVLRKLRQQRASRIRWVVTGSVGFHHVLRLAQSTEDAINDLESIPCGPLDERWAAELARRLLVGIDATFDEATVDALATASGGIPYLMHYLAASLRGHVGPCDPAAVHEAWSAFVQDRDRSRAVTHLLNRLDGYYGAHTESAHRLLDMIAVATEPVPLDALLELVVADNPTSGHDVGQRILDDLVDDHYLTETAEGFTWRYAVLRDIWSARRRLRVR